MSNDGTKRLITLRRFPMVKQHSHKLMMQIVREIEHPNTVRAIEKDTTYLQMVEAYMDETILAAQAKAVGFDRQFLAFPVVYEDDEEDGGGRGDGRA
jgi:hypothetical protein